VEMNFERDFYWVRSLVSGFCGNDAGEDLVLVLFQRGLGWITVSEVIGDCKEDLGMEVSPRLR
jgi:hypothetical protein